MAPDIADLTVSVSRTGLTSRGALSATNRATDRVVRTVRSLAISPSDIQTEGVSVSHFRRHKGGRRWSATEALDIRIRKINLVGKVIDRATKAGASSLNGPDYSFSDPSAGKIEATHAALADARRRADDATAAIGYRVTGVQSVQLDPEGAGATGGSSGSSPAAGAGTPTTVRPGTQEVDVQVQVVYTIAPA